MRKKKAKSKGKLVKELDTIFSRYIRQKYSKDGYVKCVSCGRIDKVEAMQCGHYISRSHHATRWSERNNHPQCPQCNIFLRGNYPAYTKFMIDTYGVGVIDELITLSRTIPQYKSKDIMEMIEKYKELLKSLE